MYGYPPVSIPVDAQISDYSLVLCVPIGDDRANQRQVAWSLDGFEASRVRQICPRVYREGGLSHPYDGIWANWDPDPVDEY